MEFTEAESNMNDLVSEYQQYQDASAEEEVRILGCPLRDDVFVPLISCGVASANVLRLPMCRCHP